MSTRIAIGVTLENSLNKQLPCSIYHIITYAAFYPIRLYVQRDTNCSPLYSYSILKEHIAYMCWCLNGVIKSRFVDWSFDPNIAKSSNSSANPVSGTWNQTGLCHTSTNSWKSYQTLLNAARPSVVNDHGVEMAMYSPIFTLAFALL